MRFGVRLRENLAFVEFAQLMAMSVDQALAVTSDLKKVHARLTILHDLGSRLPDARRPTPALSGGEAQRVKLANELARKAPGRRSIFWTNPPPACMWRMCTVWSRCWTSWWTLGIPSS